MVIPMGTKIDKCSIYTDRFRRQLVSFSLEQFKSFTERNRMPVLNTVRSIDTDDRIVLLWQ